jgi:hypothetical protein
MVGTSLVERLCDVEALEKEGQGRRIETAIGGMVEGGAIVT